MPRGPAMRDLFRMANSVPGILEQKRCWSRRGVKFLLQGECLLIGLSLRLMPLMQCEIYLLGRKCPPGSIFCISPR